jgi:hypothetical protein
MRFSCQLLLGSFRREVGYSSVIPLALRDKLTDAHARTIFGKERIPDIEYLSLLQIVPYAHISL